MLGIQRILRVSWTAKCINQWVLEKVGVSRCLLKAIKKRKLIYFGHTMRKHDSLEKDIIIGTLPGKWARGRPKTSWINNITAWTGITLNVTLRKTEERSEWRAVIWSAVNPQIEKD